ncbi:MAG TPA: hypothetical protein VNL77_15245 [Roseiflexaceae bacterium]|nr:hypothetical protein [Roseiflexaceae bacterium]
MRFPALDQVALPCTLEEIVPGRRHPDGRRYLPLVLLRLPDPGGDVRRVTMLGVVDRHHVVDAAQAGRVGVARLVFLLSTLRIQEEPVRQGLFDEEAPAPGRPSTAPLACGRVVVVHTWESERRHLPYEALYTELLLDVGIGTVGVRTSATATNLAESIGTPTAAPGDWLCARRSRIDILGFEAGDQVIR